MKKIDKLRMCKEILELCQIMQINNELDNKANKENSNDGLAKMKIKSLYRKVR